MDNNNFYNNSTDNGNINNSNDLNNNFNNINNNVNNIDYNSSNNIYNGQESVVNIENNIDNNNNTNQINNYNNIEVETNTSKSKKPLIFIIIVILILLIGGVVFLAYKKGLFANSNNNSIEKPNNNSNVVKSNEIVKVVSTHSKTTHMLSADGSMYISGQYGTPSFTKIEVSSDYKVLDIAYTDIGLLFKLENNNYYLVYDSIQSDETIDISYDGRTYSAKRIMLDNIVKYTTFSAIKGIQFLTKNGELYNLNYNTLPNVEKVMDNIKEVKASFYSISLIDNDNNGYVYGFNLSEKGILGKSDYSSYKGGKKEYVSKPVKIAENIKDIDSVTIPLMYFIAIYYVDENNDLYVIGESRNNNYFLGVQNNYVDKPYKIDSDVKRVYAKVDGVIAEKNNGELYYIKTGMGIQPTIKNKMIDKYKELIFYGPRVGRMLILTEDGTLYGYGETKLSDYGLGEGETKSNEIVEIKKNVKKAFIGGNNNLFLITKDGTLYAAGDNEYNQLGVSGKTVVTELTEVEY